MPDHEIVQSRFFVEHEAFLEELLQTLGYGALTMFVLLISMQSYMNLERGLFPFNTGVLADMAYRADTPGDAGLALLLGIMCGMFIWFMRRLFVRQVGNATYEQIKPVLRDIKVVKPTDAPKSG